MQDMDQLLTLELGWIELKEERANPKLYIYSTLRVNKKFEWQGSIKDKNLDEFSLVEYKQLLNKEIEK